MAELDTATRSAAMRLVAVARQSHTVTPSGSSGSNGGPPTEHEWWVLLQAPRSFSACFAALAVLRAGGALVEVRRAG
jgi:hypothetical protein